LKQVKGRYAVGVKVRNVLDSKGIKYSHVADKIGMTYPTLHSRLYGISELTAEELYAISKAIDMPLETFYPGDDMCVS
jgi:transcriptional regulator with XRE-family HTH domain